MTALDHAAFVALGRAMAARNGYRRQAVVRPVHHRRRPDRLDVRAPPDLLATPTSCIPTEKATVWGDHYPDDSLIAAQTERNRTALLHLIDRAACPYADLGGGLRGRQLRAAVRRPRDQPRLGAQRRRHGHGDLGPVGGRQPAAHVDRAGRSSSGRRSPGAAPW